MVVVVTAQRGHLVSTTREVVVPVVHQVQTNQEELVEMVLS
jgi:hypothetical protein